MESWDYEVAVAGASVAGATLALHLQAQGISAVVFERKKFPRRKPCGEGLSSRAVSELERLGMLEKLLGSPHHPFDGFVVWAGARAISFTAENTTSPNLGIGRLTLDTLLAAEVARRGTDPLFVEEEVRGAISAAGGYLVTTNKRECRSRFLVLADGARSQLAGRLGFPEQRVAKERFGLCFSLVGRFEEPLSSVHIFPLADCELFCTQTAQDTLNVAILTAAENVPALLRSGGASDLVAEATARLGFCGMVRGRPIGCGPIGCFRRRHARQGIFLIGDCLESFDPVGGMGMTHAVISARLCAEALAQALRRGCSTSEAEARYAAACRREAAVLRGFTRAVKFALRKRPLLDVAARWGLGGRFHEAACSNTNSIAARMLAVFGSSWGAGLL